MSISLGSASGVAVVGNAPGKTMSPGKGFLVSLPDPSARERGGETWREELRESECSGNGRKLELICLDSGGAGGSLVLSVAWRLRVGLPAGGVAKDVALAVEAPVCWGLANAAATGCGELLVLAEKDGPKTSSKDLSLE